MKNGALRYHDYRQVTLSDTTHHHCHHHCHRRHQPRLHRSPSGLSCQRQHSCRTRHQRCHHRCQSGCSWQQTHSCPDNTKWKQINIKCNAQDEKMQGDRGRRSAARDDGDGWRGGSQVDRKATEQQGRILKEWIMGPIVPMWKKKRDVHDPGRHRGVTLLSQVLKLLERVLDARIRRRVEGDFGEEQQGFRKGRGTADGMYILRQMVEKRLEVQGSMALGFVDLEKVLTQYPERW